MGTRADFYIGRGENAEWIGSFAWDGYPDGPRPAAAMVAESEAEFRKCVASFGDRDDFTKPEEGWPWPWECSATTDYAYAWDGDQVYVSMFGNKWLSRDGYVELIAAQKAWEAKLDAAEKAAPPGQLPVMDEEEPEWPETPVAVFPNMKTDKAAALGSKRSGLMLIGLK